MASFSAAQLVALVFSSSVLGALISLAGNHVLAQLQFKRDYFKEIIAKRLSAYQQIDEDFNGPGEVVARVRRR